VSRGLILAARLVADTAEARKPAGQLNGTFLRCENGHAIQGVLCAVAHAQLRYQRVRTDAVEGD